MPFVLSLSKGALRQAQDERHPRPGIAAFTRPSWQWSGEL